MHFSAGPDGPALFYVLLSGLPLPFPVSVPAFVLLSVLYRTDWDSMDRDKGKPEGKTENECFFGFFPERARSGRSDEKQGKRQI